MLITEALDSGEQLTDEQIFDLGYGIKYFEFSADYPPTPERMERMYELRGRLAVIEEQRRAARHARRAGQGNGQMCGCGHVSAYPMMTAHGTACPDCYDRMSD